MKLIFKADMGTPKHLKIDSYFVGRYFYQMLAGFPNPLMQCFVVAFLFDFVGL